MKIAPSYLRKAKNAAHAIQALTIFLGWCLTIAIFTKDGSTDGRTRYFFALCWFSVPALIYLTTVPLWPRARKFANPYAFAILDVVFAILWFAAFIAVATWNAAGIGAGAAKKKVQGGDCSTFDYGPEQKCRLSQATVGMGVVVCVLFAATSAISIHAAMYYRRTGTLPGATPDMSDPSSMEAQTKDAFSSDPHDAEYGDEVGLQPEPRGRREDDEYALLHASDADEGIHQGQPMHWEGGGDARGRGRREEYDTSYHAGGAYDTHHASGDSLHEDPALSHEHGDYASGGRINFPAADYTR